MSKRLDKKKQQKNPETTKTPVTAKAPSADTVVSFYIQYQNQEYIEKEIIEAVKEKCQAKGISSEELKTLSIYLKPEEKKAYYTADNKISGSVDL